MINKKQWFDVPDSLCKREDGCGEYYNVQARFSDHPILNVEKSKTARHNVYDFGLVLQMKVLRAVGDVKAQDNVSSQTLRFDKGIGMDAGDFEKAKALIMRCWDAWQHYHLFREAPVTPMERKAMEQIAQAPLTKIGSVLIDRGDGVLVERTFGEPEDEDDETEMVEVQPRPRAKPKARRAQSAAE